MNAPIFIFGSHKSGTTLLRNLFDGHPDLAVIPKEFHFFRVMGFWVSYSYSQQRPFEASAQKIRHNALELVEHFNSKGSPLADADLRGAFHLDIFKKKITRLEEETPLEQRILILLDALYAALNGESPGNDQRILHKTVGMGEFAWELQELFPKASFIHLVRDPYENLASWRKFQLATSGTYPLLDRMMSSMQNNYYFMFRNQALISRYRVLTYERLVKTPENVMKELADFLDIPFDPDHLLTPSSMGVPWQGNSTSHRAFKGVERTKDFDPHQSLYPIEIEWIDRAMGAVVEALSYQRVHRKGSIWKKAKGESIGRYFYNRFHLLSQKDRSEF